MGCGLSSTRQHSAGWAAKQLIVRGVTHPGKAAKWPDWENMGVPFAKKTDPIFRAFPSRIWLLFQSNLFMFWQAFRAIAERFQASAHVV
jgi:hypothetical protein